MNPLKRDSPDGGTPAGAIPAEVPPFASRLGPRARVTALAALMLVAAIVLCVVGGRWHPAAAPVTLHWWELVPAVFVANALVFHLEFKGESHTFNLNEIVTVVGFFCAPLRTVVICRVIGSSAYQLIRRRQVGVKLAFNVASFALDSALNLSLLHLLVGSGSPERPGTWAPALLAVAVGNQGTMAGISLAIFWWGGRPHITEAATTTGVVAAVSTGLGLLAAALLWLDPPAMTLLALVLPLAFFSYRAYFNISRRYAGLRILYDFTKAVSANLGSDGVLDDVLSQARQLLQAEWAEMVVFDDATGAATLRWVTVEDSVDGPGGIPDPALPRLHRWIAGQPTRAMLASRSSRHADAQTLKDALGVRDLLLAAVPSQDGPAAVFVVANRQGQVSTFDDDDRRLFETLAYHAGVALDNSRLLDRLRAEVEDRRHEAQERRHQALHDALTGLPNRTYFTQRTEEILAGGAQAAVMLMDLDRFKEVNDTLGHHHGDLLLSEVATRLRRGLRAEDMAARLGGDEFAIVAPHVSGAEEAQRLAGQILAAFSDVFNLQGLSLDVGASIGIALAPSDGLDASTLLQKADVAMYEAKANRGGIVCYSPERDTYTPRRLALASGLREAIEQNDLLVYFQPKASFADARTVGAEALVRWQHPQFGMVYPDEFIPIAEQTGMEPQITAYVLRAALRQCAKWLGAGLSVGVAVNVAVRSLLDPQLPGTLRAELSSSGVPPELVTLEITESSVMADPERVIAVLKELGEVGIRLSVDDFGTGYSSLAYLQRLPVQEVKVDKSFVFRMATDKADAMIVESIVHLGHKLGLTVVAEGVEDEEAWARLQAMGCDIAQGYLLSRPVPGSTLTRWVCERNLAGPPDVDHRRGLRPAPVAGRR